PRASRGPSRGPFDPSLSRLDSPSPSSSPAFTAAREAVALDLLVEIAAWHLQCARGLRDVPVVLLELAVQEGTLGRLLESLERGGAEPRGIAAPCRGRPLPPSRSRLPSQSVDAGLHARASRRKYQEPLHRVLELADVARPIVRRQPL